MRFLIIPFLLVAFTASGSDFSTKVKPFLDKYCVECHGEKKQKSGLRLDTLSTKLDDLETAEEWQHVLDELNGATMPPDDEAQPNKEELSSILESLTFEIEKAKKSLYGKDRNIVMRRLNRRDYVNTVYDLTGIKVSKHAVPEDGKSAEFDTNGKGLFMSSYQFEKYLELGKDIIGKAIYAGSKPKPVNLVLELEKNRNKSVEKHIARTKKRLAEQNNKNRNLEKDLEAFNYYKTVSAIKKSSVISPFFCYSGSRSFFTDLGFGVFRKNFTPGLYRFEVTVGHGDMKTGDRAMFNLDLNYRYKTEIDMPEYYEVTATYQKPQKVTIEAYIDKQSSFKIISKISRSENNMPFIAIDKIKVTGPHYKQWPPESHKKIFPAPKGDHPEDEYIDKVLNSFALKAFKYRKPTVKFLDTLKQLYNSNRTAGMSMEKAIQEPLAVILSSPKFLYMVEGTQDTKKIRDWELASRLSYFLWSSRPDQQLFNLAKQGTLHKPEVLRAQVKRMLKDKKSLAMSKGFVPQWLHLHKLDEVDVHKKRFPRYDEIVERSMKMESVHFFHTIATKNLSTSNFIDSNFVTINNVLSDYYGLPSTGKDGFTTVKLPANSGRGGLLGQGSVLVMTGNGIRTSPVLRGAFIMSKILGMPSPEPPPNVPQLESAKTKGLSIRDALKVHQEQPQCSSCHKRIDPLGFGLENFDAAGVWHDKKQLGRKKTAPFDTKGKLPNGKAYNNVHDMKKLLMEQKDKFNKSLIESLMGYAFGREIGFADAKLIDELLEKSKANGYRLGDLIVDIVSTPEFRQK